MRKGLFSKLIWGIFLLLAAAFVVINQFEGFIGIGLGSIIAVLLSVFVIVQCIAHLNIAPLPIPLAALYIVFQTPLNLPKMGIWPLIIAALLATIGLSVLLPKGLRRKNHIGVQSYGTEKETEPQLTSNNNNPSFSVKFGYISRRLQANCLETAHLHCEFGAMDLYLDQAQLSPNGAEIVFDCSFGGINLYVPKHWQIIDQLSCSLGGVNTDKCFSAPEANAPKLTLSGKVSLGGVEVKYI